LVHSYEYEWTNSLMVRMTDGTVRHDYPVAVFMRMVIATSPTGATGTALSSWTGGYFTIGGEHHRVNTDRGVLTASGSSNRYLNLVARATGGAPSGGECIVRAGDREKNGLQRPAGQVRECAVSGEVGNAAFHVERFRTSAVHAPPKSRTLIDDEPDDDQYTNSSTPVSLLVNRESTSTLPAGAGATSPLSAVRITTGKMPVASVRVPVVAGQPIVAELGLTGTLTGQELPSGCVAMLGVVARLTSTPMPPYGNDALQSVGPAYANNLFTTLRSLTLQATVSAIATSASSRSAAAYATLYAYQSGNATTCGRDNPITLVPTATSVAAHGRSQGTWNTARTSVVGNGAARTWDVMSSWSPMIATSLAPVCTPRYSAAYSSQHVSTMGFPLSASTRLAGTVRSGALGLWYFSPAQNHADMNLALEGPGEGAVEQRLLNRGAGSLQQNGTSSYGRIGQMSLASC